MPENIRFRNRGGWARKSIELFDKIETIVNSMQEYWPLTLRQIYYQLVQAGTIPNNINSYKHLSRLLTKARLDGFLPWRTMEDRARSTLKSGGWDQVSDFISHESTSFLSGYRRNLLQTQPVYPEIWIEKDALSHLCHSVSFPFCTDVIVAKGFSSVSYLNKARERINQRIRFRDQPTTILYFGDLDPSGWEMLPSMLLTLQDEMNLGSKVGGVRCALTPEQVQQYNLPINPDALKMSDSRARKYVEQFGDLAVELDALPPKILQETVRSCINQHLDTDLFDEQLSIQDEERKKAEHLKDKASDLLIDEDIDDTD